MKEYLFVVQLSKSNQCCRTTRLQNKGGGEVENTANVKCSTFWVSKFVSSIVSLHPYHSIGKGAEVPSASNMFSLLWHYLPSSKSFGCNVNWE